MLAFARLLQGMSAGAGMVVGPGNGTRPLFRTRCSNSHVLYDHRLRACTCGGAHPGRLAGSRLGVAIRFRLPGRLRISSVAACAYKLPRSSPLARRSPLRLRATLRDYATVGSDARFLLQSVSIALAASALFLYISSAPVFVLQILHLPETAFAWLFAPMITGIMAGSLVAGRVAHFWSPDHTIRIGFLVMVGAAVANVTLRRVLHSCHSLGRCPDHALHVRHGSRIAGHDHSDAGPLSRPARLGRIAPVRFRHGRFFNLFRFAGASPLRECFQAGMRRLGRPSRQRCVLVLWTALQKNRKAFRMTGTSTRAFGSVPGLLFDRLRKVTISMQSIEAKELAFSGLAINCEATV